MRTFPGNDTRLVGRHDEQRRVEELIEAAGAGHGGALVLRGEAGIGKSALLEHALGAASGFTVLRASGSEFEQELPYAALHQLCVPMLEHLDELPDRHRDALRVAFGLADGSPDPFRAGLAILELATATRRGPLLCVIDDAQWLDPASARVMSFLGRRIAADPVAMVIGVRDPAPMREMDDLPVLPVRGLSDEEARALLAARSPMPLDERVRDRLVAEAYGNPLALLELPRAGGFAAPGPSSVTTRIERGFQSRLAGLPGDARLLLVVASADATGDPGLLWPAARLLGLDVSRAREGAAATGLAEFGTRVRFCHPLARSTVYRAADDSERRTAHRVLAEVTDPDLAPDRRAWHRAHAGVGPDDDVAAELERSASRAEGRGGVAAAAAFLERAAAMSLDTGRRVERTLTAAEAHIDAGTIDAAADLLTTIEVAHPDEPQRARADLLRGRIAFLRPADGTGPALMASAARRLAPTDPARARACFLDALEMSLRIGRGGGFVDEIMTAARAVAPASATPDALDALVLLSTEGYRAAAPALGRAVNDSLWTRFPAVATMVAAELWDVDTSTAIAGWLVKAGRESGAPMLLRLGLAQRSMSATLAGDPGAAIAASAEEAAIADAVGEPPLIYHRLHLAALRGRRAEFDDLLRTADRGLTDGGAGQVTNRHWALAVLNNGLGDYRAALLAGRQAIEDGGIFNVGTTLPELIEAAVRCDEPAIAGRALELLTERTETSGYAAGRGVAAYARGLVTGVEDHYREAVDQLARTSLIPYRARAHLLYGEWLRRRSRRRDCLEQLGAAHEMFTTAGAEAFAHRAAEEMRAAGERVQRRPGPAYEQLTAQEIAVARLVAEGATSHEVAVQLFISKRTVDAHLRNIFRKLGITSRRQLRDHDEALGHSRPTL